MQPSNIRIFIHSSSPVFRSWIESNLLSAGVRVYAKIRADNKFQALDENFFNILIADESMALAGFNKTIHVPVHQGLEDMKFGVLPYIFSQIPEYWHLFKTATYRMTPSQNIVFLGLSTGGPAALEKILPKIQLNSQTIYVLAQHMPAGQTQGLVDHLSRKDKLMICEASHLGPLNPGKWYVLPSGFQSFFGVDRNHKPVFFQTTTPETLHKPLIDLSLYSIALAFRKNLLAGILTGMGSDGALALKLSRDLEASTFAESRQSALVFGMPKTALEMGATSNEISLLDIPDFIHKWSRVIKGNSDVA